MRFYPKAGLLFLLFCLVVIPAALAQQKGGSGGDPDLPRKATGSRPLTLGEGLAILSAALDARRHSDFPSDCSHFVHRLYERAGFPYGYASSSELYAGIDEFRRVANPQPGDLAVWRGHAGIVINPVQHSFFSLLSSGPGVDSYNSPYWMQKGRPRFFRYVRAAPNGALSSSVRTASLKPTISKMEAHTSAAEDPVPNIPSETGASTAENQITNPTTPHTLVVNSVRPKPDQVVAAFLHACTDSEESLRGRDLFKLAPSLVVFDRFAVRKVHLTGNQVWVEVQIDELFSLRGSKAEVHKRSERRRWPLTRRDNTSWELTPSPGTIYLPQHAAVRILAQELAQLTEDSPDGSVSRTQDKAELARLLDLLLER